MVVLVEALVALGLELLLVELELQAKDMLVEVEKVVQVMVQAEEAAQVPLVIMVVIMVVLVVLV
jgi:hypothetical protein